MRSICAASLVLAASVATRAEEAGARVTIDEARLLTSQLITGGQPAAARQIALGVLKATPRDVRVLITLAQAEIALGHVAAAERAAQMALHAATTQTEHFLAALSVADIFSRTERFTRSQLWLRRAQDLAQTPAETAVIANAYRAVRARNPLSMQLQFGMRPSSNVNSGNSNETITFAYLPGVFGTIPWEVPADERPLSGLELSADVSFRYRLHATDRSQTTLEVGAYGRTYLMSPSSREKAPGVTGESLSYGNLSIGVGHQWVATGRDDFQYGASLEYDRAFDVDGAASQSVNLDISVVQSVGETDSLSYGLSVVGAEYVRSGATARTVKLRSRWRHDLGNGRSIATASSAARAVSDDRNRDYTSTSLAVTYSAGEVLPQIDLSTTAQAEWRTFDSVSLDPSGRDDLITSVQLSAGLGQFETFGFEPVATLRAQRTDSSVPYYDTESVTLGITFRSSF